MKPRNAAILLDDTITTIKGRFASSKSDEYTFLCKKDIARYLEVGDYIVTETMNGLSVVKVTEIHEESDIDLDTNFTYRWAFQKVHVTELENLGARLVVAEKSLKSMQRDALRQQIRQHIEQGRLLAPVPPVKEKASPFEADLDDDVPL